MKRLGLFLVGILLLCATSCDCPDCGVAKFSIDTKIFLVTKHADGSQTCAPEAIKFTTSYEWTASNSAPKYIDFSTTEVAGGVLHFDTNGGQGKKILPRGMPVIRVGGRG